MPDWSEEEPGMPVQADDAGFTEASNGDQEQEEDADELFFSNGSRDYFQFTPK